MNLRLSLPSSLLALPLLVHLLAAPSVAAAQDVPIIGQDIAYASGIEVPENGLASAVLRFPES